MAAIEHAPAGSDSVDGVVQPAHAGVGSGYPDRLLRGRKASRPGGTMTIVPPTIPDNRAPMISVRRRGVRTRE